MFPQNPVEHAFPPMGCPRRPDFVVAFAAVFLYNIFNQILHGGKLWGSGVICAGRVGMLPKKPKRERKRAAPMLMGEFQHNMDQKGRVTVPSRFREDLGERFCLCKGLDGCLFVLSLEQWQRLVEKITAIPLAKGRSVQRYFLAGAAEVEPDKQGRVLVPQNLREHAGLDKDVTLVGMGSRAEMWDTARWRAYNSGQDEADIEASMEMLDI